jgi:hypothetical protein
MKIHYNSNKKLIKVLKLQRYTNLDIKFQNKKSKQKSKSKIKKKTFFPEIRPVKHAHFENI